MSLIINDYVIIFTIINVISFIIMGIDKLKATKGMFRVSEKAIFIFAVVFGALGVYFGMYIFKHKTKKIKFYVTIPILMLVQLSILYYLIISI